jgi:L-sorbose 1-phosphate reductase
MSKNVLDEYKSATAPIPARMLRWHLYGAGLESFGKEGKPEEVDVPAYGPNELLVRQDACGLCFSDTKVIGLGENHPRMTGRNLATDPVTLGHEVSVTVVGVGAELTGRFNIGDRFVIQADVFYKGKSMAYGYAIKGGLAEYSVISTPIIDGDEGCYLLPIKPDTGYVESALTEPWACVVSAYAQSHRDGIKNGGRVLVICDPGKDAPGCGVEALFKEGHIPATVLILSSAENACVDFISAISEKVGVVSHRGSTDFSSIDWPALKAAETDGAGFDDIFLTGAPSPETIEGAALTVADHGVVGLIGASGVDRKLTLDIGRIHYNWHYYLGATTDSVETLYDEQRTADLKEGGLTWIIGAGGPMGQMHVQRAVLHKNPPRRIVCTDVDAIRLQSVADRFGADARERGVDLITLNPNVLGQEAFDAEIARLGEGNGYDDILSMVPVAALIEHAQAYLAPGGWFNIFAGVARGTMAKLDVTRIVTDRVRFIGSSGSSLADMRNTLQRVEEDDLSTNASLAAVGGMAAAQEGLKAVKEGWFPGKTLIFPLIHDMPLTPLPELKEKYPTVYALLKDGTFWTQEAEEELLRLHLG